MGGKSEQAGTIDTTGRTTGTTTGTTRGTSAVNIPAFLRPFLTQQAGVARGALGDLRGLLNRPELVAGFTPQQQQAFDLAGQFGQSAPFTTALDALQSTAGGDFLFGGPGQQAFVDAAVRSAQPDVISRFGGRGGSGLAAASIGQSAVDASANLFNQERQRQLQAAQALPGLSQLPIDLLLQTGGLQQQLAQQQINAPIAAQQQLLQAATGNLPVSSLLGSTQTGRTTGRTTGTSLTQQPFFENPLANILGGASALGGLGSAFGPFGTALGGIGGGLLGAFG